MCDKHLKPGNNKPRVSIGMPLYNSEKYLEETLDSILAQTYSDFELIISDNASTDHTQQICREYAANDSRISYYCNKNNLGAAKNFNRVFELSSGEYFKWAAYDDLLDPKFLQKCVSVLDKDPSIVLCHSKTARIDEHGTLVGNYDHRTLERISSWKPHERFGDLISIRNPCWAIFGVFRTRSLAKTPLLGNYIGADRNLLAEIGLIGRIYEIPEYLFLRRDHPQAYTRSFCENPYAIAWDNYCAQMAYWTKEDLVMFPNWKNLFEYIRSVRRVPLKWSERLLCYEQICSWVINEGWKHMGGDLENVLLRRSPFGRKLVSVFRSNLRRTVIPFIKKVRR